MCVPSVNQGIRSWWEGGGEWGTVGERVEGRGTVRSRGSGESGSGESGGRVGESGGRVGECGSRESGGRVGECGSRESGGKVGESGNGRVGEEWERVRMGEWGKSGGKWERERGGRCRMEGVKKGRVVPWGTEERRRGKWRR